MPAKRRSASRAGALLALCSFFVHAALAGPAAAGKAALAGKAAPAQLKAQATPTSKFAPDDQPSPATVSKASKAQQAPTNTSKATNQTVDPLLLPDCADVPVSSRQLDLAARADIVLTGITLAAGPGAGRCDANSSALNIALDNSTEPATNFIVMGVQCVHKGLVSCRSNEEDTKDCLILVAAPSMKDAAPCSLSQGERYQVYLQKQTNGCGGYYLSMYERIYHSVRRPLGGTGCTFYPAFPDPKDLQTQLAGTCDKPVACEKDMCSPLISKSPCANDTSVTCSLKTCPGKYMYHNAIMPEDTCYELYNYETSGLPTNCYGRRYINNRIRELAKNDQFFGNATETAASNDTMPAAAGPTDTTTTDAGAAMPKEVDKTAPADPKPAATTTAKDVGVAQMIDMVQSAAGLDPEAQQPEGAEVAGAVGEEVVTAGAVKPELEELKGLVGQIAGTP